MKSEADNTPTSPAAPRDLCECPRPVYEERAERRGAARTYCARCDRPVPLRMGAR